MNWIMIAGVAFVCGGMFLFYFGQKLKSRFDNNRLRKRVNKMTDEVDQLVNSNNELHSRVDQYKKGLSEKEKNIHQLTDQIDKQNVAVEEYRKCLEEKDETVYQLTEQAGRQNTVIEEYQKRISEQDETIHRFTAQVDKLNADAEGYRKSLSEQDKTIHQLTSRNSKRKIAAEEFQDDLSGKDKTFRLLTEQLDNVNIVTEEYTRNMPENGNNIHRFTTRINKREFDEKDKDNISKRNKNIKQRRSWFKKFKRSASKTSFKTERDTNGVSGLITTVPGVLRSTTDVKEKTPGVQKAKPIVEIKNYFTKAFTGGKS
ncbi:hypothetical protein SCALIN_C01_0164 [Candidatus Scalindua japonica]|uniref:Uncharacterized protein n=1 Tax=Candidatus Scalindua japonica TaxID=1284222 RepID=A0A286TTP8_9BACT|nr:DUF948 domain-containing protein [Candidatus Scalindua japonica]GAX59233.1 hypothetical protein SCALIN_C01_0164 [Candidatus Scalindua japonica]